MKMFLSGIIGIAITTLLIQMLDYSMIFYDYRVILGILGGYYILPKVRLKILKRL